MGFLFVKLRSSHSTSVSLVPWNAIYTARPESWESLSSDTSPSTFPPHSPPHQDMPPFIVITTFLVTISDYTCPSRSYTTRESRSAQCPSKSTNSSAATTRLAPGFDKLLPQLRSCFFAACSPLQVCKSASLRGWLVSGARDREDLSGMQPAEPRKARDAVQRGMCMMWEPQAIRRVKARKRVSTHHEFPTVLWPFSSARRRYCAALNCGFYRSLLVYV